MSFTPRKVDQYAIRAISSHDAFYTGGRLGASACSTATVWVANLAVYVPFRIHERVTIYEWYITNAGATAAHDCDFGIYREDFTAIQRLGETTMSTSGNALINTTTWTNLDLDPGSYYMAFWSDNNSGTRNYVTSTDALGLYQAMGCVEEGSLTTGLPSTATPVAYARAFLPSFGMNLHNIAL